MTSLNIHQRIHAAMNDVSYIQKERKHGMNYTIVSHDAVTAKVRPILHKHGIIYYPVAMSRSQDGNRTEMDLTVRFVNIDEPGDYVDVACCGYGCDNQDKGPGKAISYAVKYALLKVLGLETGDDPDNEELPHEPDERSPADDFFARAKLAISNHTDAAKLQAWVDANLAHLNALPPEQGKFLRSQFQKRMGALCQAPVKAA